MKKIISSAIASLFAVAAIAFAPAVSASPASVNAAGVAFDFYTEEDIDLVVNESYVFEDIATIDGVTLDARLTVLAHSMGAELNAADNDESDGIESKIFVPCGDNCDPFEETFVPADGYKGEATYRVDFLEAGTENLVTLTNLSFYVKDIDTWQYVEVLDPNSYVLDAETALSALYPDNNPEIELGHVRFMETEGVESDSDEQPHWVQVNFDSLSSLTYKIGQEVPGGVAIELMFESIVFDNPVEYQAVFTEPVSISKKVFFDGDSAYLKPMWFKKLDKMIASVPSCATDVNVEIISSVKKAKSEVKGSNLAERRAAIVKKFLTKRGLNVDITLKPNGKGKKAKNNQRSAKIVVTYNSCST